MTISLHWFRRDLRLHDNPALAASVSASTTSYAVFCVDELSRLYVRQRAFAVAALRQLAAALGKLDASLSMLEADPADALVRAAKRLGATRVTCARAFDRAEIEVEARARARLGEAGVELRQSGGPVVHEPEAVDERKQSPGEGYRIFPPFYAAWKALPLERPLDAASPNGRDVECGAIPETAPPRGAGQPIESSALEALSRFVTARAGDYGANAEYPGRPATSGLARPTRSPWG
jgi:deoxyribodipyrimidine photo-lyase